MSWQAQYQSRKHAEFYANKRDATALLRVSNYFERRMIARAIRRVRRKSAFHSALDCASGTGRMLPVLAEFDAAVVALDTSAEMLAEGRRFHGLFRTPPQGTVGSAMELPLADKSVDVVLCSRLIHHFPDSASRVRILREFARVARVGVVVSFFDRASYRGWRRSRRNRKPHRDHGRFTVSRQQFQDEAEAAGLSLLGMNSLLRFHTEVTAAAMLVGSTESGAINELRALGVTSSDGLWNFKPQSVAALSGSSDTFRVECEPSEEGGPSEVYIKRYRYDGWGPAIRGLFRGTFFGRSRARLEYEHLTEMRRRGVSAVKPLRCIEDRRAGWLRSAALITEAALHAQSMEVYWRRAHVDWSEARQRQFVEALGRSIAALHQAGVRHGGLYARNVLVAESNGQWDFTLLDPSRRCRFYSAPTPLSARASDLSDLAASGAPLDRPDAWDHFLNAYCKAQTPVQDPAVLNREVPKRASGKLAQEDHRIAVGAVLSWLQRRMEETAGSRAAFDSVEGFFARLGSADLGGVVAKPVAIQFKFAATAGGGSDRGGAAVSSYFVRLDRQGVSVGNETDGIADLTVQTDAEAWLSVINARPDAIDAIRSGRVRLDGSVKPLALLAQWIDRQAALGGPRVDDAGRAVSAPTMAEHPA